MKLYNDINEIYSELKVTNKMESYLLYASKEERLAILNTIVEQALLGTCSNFDEILADYGVNLEYLESLLGEDLIYKNLDEFAFCCDQCGWWNEAWEADDGVCESCRELEE